MSLSLAHDPPAESGIRTGNDVDLLASALHHALQNLADDKHTNIEIIVNNDVLTLRGTAVDVTPALLSGHVVLHLAESTTLKQITLQFRGKAKLPPLAGES
jgi:arrestin-related trafficking adapter 4/5/7